MDKQDKRIRASVVEQPLEGLLYDLDLTPEQCLSDVANMGRISIEVLRREIERLKKENEWLLEESITLYDLWHDVSCGDEDIKHKMQQALKEK